ncbi:MAG: hypothetical protein GF393_11975 [Armatimonadia bacterium]|nr:hypothetical protein [Armatimonadia bacterium]
MVSQAPFRRNRRGPSSREQENLYRPAKVKSEHRETDPTCGVVGRMKTTHVLLILALCTTLVALWGCPAQETEEMPDQVPPPGATGVADDVAGDADGGHDHGEHMNGDHEPGEHMDGHNPSSEALSGEMVEGTRVVEVEAKRYEFVPDPIVVEAGEPVKLEVTATDVAHGFGLEAMEINVTLPPNETQTVEFTPEEAGEYHIHCTEYCGPGHSDMHGTLLVKQ